MAKNKAKWQKVNNSYVIETFKQPECANCQGKGYVGEHPNYVPCSCAVLAFRRAGDSMVVEGRLRVRQQSIGGRMLSWFEYRDMGVI